MAGDGGEGSATGQLLAAARVQITPPPAGRYAGLRRRPARPARGTAQPRAPDILRSWLSPRSRSSRRPARLWYMARMASVSAGLTASSTTRLLLLQAVCDVRVAGQTHGRDVGAVKLQTCITNAAPHLVISLNVRAGQVRGASHSQPIKSKRAASRVEGPHRSKTRMCAAAAPRRSPPAAYLLPRHSALGEPASGCRRGGERGRRWVGREQAVGRGGAIRLAAAAANCLLAAKAGLGSTPASTHLGDPLSHGQQPAAGHLLRRGVAALQRGAAGCGRQLGWALAARAAW